MIRRQQQCYGSASEGLPACRKLRRRMPLLRAGTAAQFAAFRPIERTRPVTRLRRAVARC